MRKSLLLAALLTVAVVPVACSSKTPPPAQTPMPAVDAGGMDAAASGEAGASAIAVSMDAGIVDAGAADAAVSDAGAVPPAMAEAADGAIDLAIKAAAQTLAPGSQSEGQPGRATLAQGQHFNMVVTLQPNRCYTVIGYSPAGGIAQLDLKLMAPPLYTLQAGQSGPNDKNQPVIGKGKQALCPVLPLPLAYRLDATALKGSGRMGVVVFSRAK